MQDTRRKSEIQTLPHAWSRKQMNDTPCKKTNVFGIPVPAPNEILSSDRPKLLAEKLLHVLFCKIGDHDESSARLIDRVFSILGSRIEINSLVEVDLRRLVASEISQESLKSILSSRAASITRQIRPLVVGYSVLDYGCGDGLVGLGLQDDHAVTLCDIVDYRNSASLHLPYFLIPPTGKIPFEDRAFDTILLLTVLHHADDPRRVAQEACRLARHRIIVIESVVGVDQSCCLLGDPEQPNSLRSQHELGNFLELSMGEQLMFASFIDWFYNRILHIDVNVPYNFGTPRLWNELFFDLGAQGAGVCHLGLDQLAVPEFHTLHLFNLPAS